MSSAMARARLTDGIEVIFDQDSRSSFRSGRSRSGSRSSGSSGSGGSRHHHQRSSRREDHHRRHHRSSSSSSSSSSVSSSSRADRPRSRSHPRCHRPADRCRCDDHYSRYTRRHGGGGRRRRSPPRHYRSRSRSYSPNTRRSYSPNTRRSASQKRDRSSRRYSAVRTTSPSQSPLRNSRSRSRSRSRSSGGSVSLSVDAKRELLSIAAANAVKLLGVEKLELPESVRPILEDSRDSCLSTPEPEPEERVRPEPVHERSRSQRSDESDEDDASPRMSPKRKIISFSINNSVAKPTVAPNCPKVTSRMDIVGSRKPYGHWVQVRAPGKISMSHTLTTSR